MKKSIDTGFYSWEPIPLLGRSGKPQLFTRLGAQRYANKLAKQSPIPNAVGVVCDTGNYWRVYVAGDKITGGF